MTISVPTARSPYLGNGVATVFNVGFYFLLDSEVTVILVNDATKVETTLTLGVEYTQTGAGVMAATGQVTMTTAPADTEHLVILRNAVLTQLTDYITGNGFDDATAETDFDRLVMLVQQINEVAARSLRMTPGYTGAASFVLPHPAANTMLGWSSDGLSLVNGLGNTPGPIKVTANVDFNVPGGGGPGTLYDDVSFAVPGASLGDVVTIGFPVAASVPGAATTFFGWVSAVDAVTVRAVNATGGWNPAAFDITVHVWPT